MMMLVFAATTSIAAGVALCGATCSAPRTKSSNRKSASHLKRHTTARSIKRSPTCCRPPAAAWKSVGSPHSCSAARRSAPGCAWCWDNLLAAAVGAAVGAIVPCCGSPFAASDAWPPCDANFRRRSKWSPIASARVAILESASTMAAEELTGPLAGEFRYASKQLSLGHSPLAVLERLVRRVPLPEIPRLRHGGARPSNHGRQPGHVHRPSGSGGSRKAGVPRAFVVCFGRQPIFGYWVGRRQRARRRGAALLQPTYYSTLLGSPSGPFILVAAAGLYIVGLLWSWRILKVNY